MGRKQHRDDGKASDTKSGPAACIRNIAIAFRGVPYKGRRLVVTDRFYTSIPMVQQLRTMGFNFCGTIQKSRLGWCKDVEYASKKRPKCVPRGIFKMASAKSNPGMIALGWMDNRPVYFLSSQVSTKMTTIQRREKTGEITTVPCPSLVVDYQKYMGGVDRHDQLRLQSYSLQLITRFTKYYKSLFLGLVDMAVVNCYIIHNMWREKNGKTPKDHHNFLVDLQAALVQESEQSFTQFTREHTSNLQDRAHVPGVSVLRVPKCHALAQTDDKYQYPDGSLRRRPRSCKVCSYYKVRKIYPSESFD